MARQAPGVNGAVLTICAEPLTKYPARFFGQGILLTTVHLICSRNTLCLYNFDFVPGVRIPANPLKLDPLDQTDRRGREHSEYHRRDQK